MTRWMLAASVMVAVVALDAPGLATLALARQTPASTLYVIFNDTSPCGRRA